MKLSGTQLGFLARLSKSPDGQLLLELFKARLAENDAALRAAPADTILRAQGRAMELSEIIADITEAQTRLTRNQQTAPALSRLAA
jgi:hypothetical protein